MQDYEVKCADGSDRNCKKKVTVSIEVLGLTKSQLKEIEQSGGTTISAKQVENSKLSLNQEDKKQLAENGNIYYKVDLDNTCGPCGSDQDYDEEGNNITAL